LRLPKISSKYKSAIVMALGLVVFIIYLDFFVGINSLFELISKLNLEQYSLYYSIAIGALFLSVFFDSLIWHSLLQGLKVKMKLRKVILYNWIGNFVEMVIPCETVCGEVTRIYLARKETKENVGITAAPVITSRILSTFVYIGGLLVGSLVLVATRKMPVYLLGTLLLISVGTVGVIGAIFYLALKEGAVEKLVGVFTALVKVVTKSRQTQETQREKLRVSLYSFSEAFKTYKKRPKLLVKPMIYAVIGWLFTLLLYLMVFYSLNFTSISLLDLAMVYCVSSTVETLTAGFPVGAVEITMTSLYSALGVPLVIAGAATTLTRLLTFWFQIIVGYPLVQYTGLKDILKGSLSEGLLES
jgi:glycosyltransferase 2 family protein